MTQQTNTQTQHTTQPNTQTQTQHTTQPNTQTQTQTQNTKRIKPPLFYDSPLRGIR